VGWGLFHLKVSHDIYRLGLSQHGVAQGRTFQLAAYMLCISLAAVIVAVSAIRAVAAGPIGSTWA
jgi:hypothetical protein